jgi:hypothetical protein
VIIQTKIIIIIVVLGGVSASAFAQDISTIQVYGVDDMIEYDIDGAKLIYIIPDENSFSLLVNIDTTKDGQITLNLPRELIDAKKQNDQDETFIILIDGMEVLHDELSTDSKYRKISIDFEHGDSEIEIIGTHLLISNNCSECIYDEAVAFLENSEGWISFDDLPLIYEESDLDVEISRLHDQINNLKIETKSLKQEIKNLQEIIKNQ